MNIGLGGVISGCGGGAVIFVWGVGEFRGADFPYKGKPMENHLRFSSEMQQ